MSLRRRPPGLSDSQRRNSTLSDSVSEARNSIRSSTDDLFFPRVAHGDEADLSSEESHWQSAPLALALFPAIAGVFFRNGSAVVTDVTLLVLAAIFLNWSVRLPWYVLSNLFLVEGALTLRFHLLGTGIAPPKPSASRTAGTTMQLSSLWSPTPQTTSLATVHPPPSMNLAKTGDPPPPQPTGSSKCTSSPPSHPASSSLS